MKKIIKKQDGFTLIEVVLVLAIGALIILMALLAFNGASKSRRDTARTNAAGQFAASLEQYASNTSGSYPTSLTGYAFTTSMQDPSTKANPIVGGVSSTTALFYAPGKQCVAAASPTTAPTLADSAGSYAITYKQESGVFVCKDNQ